MNPENPYQKKIEEELERYKTVENVHDLPEIFHFWSHKYLGPILRSLGYRSLEDLYVDYMDQACERKPNETCRFVSIGAGNCDIEVNVAVGLKNKGKSNFVFECLDINTHMLDRGKTMAEEKGVGEFMEFKCEDLNKWEVNYKYDIVLAVQCLHHFVELEIIFEKIHNFLDDKGFFITNDMIGRNGHMRWPETKALIDQLWDELPQRYKFHHQLKRLEDPFLDWDCSQQGFEGIRAQDILPLLVDQFHFETFIVWGGLTDVVLDRGFGHNYDANSQWDRDFIDKVHKINREHLLEGKIKPTQMIATMTKNPIRLRYYHDGLQPKDCVRDTSI